VIGRLLVRVAKQSVRMLEAGETAKINAGVEAVIKGLQRASATLYDRVLKESEESLSLLTGMIMIETFREDAAYVPGVWYMSATSKKPTWATWDSYLEKWQAEWARRQRSKTKKAK